MDSWQIKSKLLQTLPLSIHLAYVKIAQPQETLLHDMSNYCKLAIQVLGPGMTGWQVMHKLLHLLLVSLKRYQG